MAGKIPQEFEVLTDEQQLNEYIMTSLRTADGMDLRKIGERWGTEISLQISKRMDNYTVNGYAFREDDHVRLTAEGLLHADGIASALFY